MNNGLRDSISSLAATFASSVVAAIRSSNLQDILDLASEAKAAPRAHAPAAAPSASAPRPARAKRRRARPAKKEAAPVVKPAPAPAAKAPTRAEPAAKAAPKAIDRLARRSPADIAKALDKILSHLKDHKAGLRSEQLREQLRMDKKEMPRVLKEGLSRRVLKSKGQKRSTVYTAT